MPIKNGKNIVVFLILLSFMPSFANASSNKRKTDLVIIQYISESIKRYYLDNNNLPELIQLIVPQENDNSRGANKK